MWVGAELGAQHTAAFVTAQRKTASVEALTEVFLVDNDVMGVVGVTLVTLAALAITIMVRFPRSPKTERKQFDIR
jgi:hypothetical protein